MPLIAGPTPLPAQYADALAVARAQFVATHLANAALLRHFDNLPIYTICWLAINRTRFIAQEIGA